MTLPIDVLADSQDNDKPLPKTAEIEAISKLAVEYGTLEYEIKDLEDKVAMKKARKLEIERVAMVRAMENAGCTSFVATNGRSIKVEEVVQGNIPAITSIEKAKGPEKALLVTRREQAIATVREKWPGLIKTELSLSLGRGEAGLASRIAEKIRELFQLQPSIDETIHPGTLNSHFKELRDNGQLGDIPVEPFALFIGSIAKIK